MKSEFDHLIGKPFGEYGRGPDCYDCWGVIIESGRLMGEDTPDYEYISHKESDKIWDKVRRHITEYDLVTEPKKGDIILFKTIVGEAHFGRMINSYQFIQATEELGVHVSAIDGFYRQLVKGFYRCKK